MPPLAWDKIMTVEPSDLEPDDIDNLYDMLKDGDAGKESDPIKLKKLYDVTKEIMIMKHQDSEEAITEAEKEAVKAEKKENELKGKITKLHKEIDELKRYGPGDTGGHGALTARDTRYLRDQIRDLEEQNQQLHDESRDLQRDLSNEKRAAEKYSEKINELEDELSRLRKDNDQYRQDISDYMMQLQAQRENLVSRRGDDQDIRDKMAKKNRELSDVMEELQNLTDNNDVLRKRCEELEANLSEANEQMFKTAEDYQKIKNVLQQSDEVTDRLRQENEVLSAQIEDLTDQAQSKRESDDAIMVAVNNKVEEWKGILSDKEQSIAEYREQVFKLREQLIAANMDTDKASVAALSQAIKDKDKQIEELTEKISQYVIDMESNAVIIDDLRNELSRGGKGNESRFASKVRELQTEVKDKCETMKNYENEAKRAEEDASVKDKELAEVLERMRQYEAGEYGLQEAVAEIKECKTQVKIRDRQIEELTRHINQTEMKVNDVLDENEELRYKLGMDPKEHLDLVEFRKNKAIRKEEEKALNFILQREIERLEDERIDLKKKVRKLAQHTGQRAVALGLTAEDMIAVQEYTEDLKHKHQNKSESVATIIKREVAQEEKIIRSHEYKNEYKRNQDDIEHYQQKNAELRARSNQLEEENQNLKDSFKEVVQVLKEKAKDGKVDSSAMHLPTLDRMLAALEAKKVIGGHDTSSYMKEQFDIMRGRNEELRNELRESRVEATKHALERDKAFDKIEKLEKDHVALQESGGGPGVFRALPLPEGMAITSTEIIASLNEHLVVTLQENSIKDENVRKMESSLENYKRKFAVMRHQQGLVYQDYLTEKKEFEEEMKKIKEQQRNLEGMREDDQVRLQEFDRLIDTLGQDDVEVRRRVAELTRKITVLRVNEKALTRRHAIMEETETTLRKNVANLNKDMAHMETAVQERMGYLQRYKDMATFKIGGLQKALDDSVPSSDLDKVNRQYHELTEKYRDMLEKGNTLVNKAEAVIGLENEVQRLTETNEEIKKTMAIEKEKLHALEAAMEELHRRGVTDGKEVHVTDGDIISISKKITMLEMKELNERQRAEHAVRMYEQQKAILHDLETRNKTLEDKFADTTKMNLEMQKIERDLRDELANSVLKSISDADRKKVSELDETVVILQQEISKLKEISEVAGSQVKTLEMQNVSREKEMTSLRQQLLDFQMQSDEKTIIGKLHRHIVQLQVSEGTAVKKWEEAKKKINKSEAHLLRLEQKVDEKDKTIYHNRTEAQNKAKYLKRSLQDLRIQFAGAVPLSKQERFSKLMSNLMNDKTKLEVELTNVNKQREDMEDKIAALTLQHESLQELISTLKDGHGAAKVKEWHGKMDAIRLEELKLKRQTTKLSGQIRYLEDLIKSHEVTIIDLEAENVRLMKDYEERQLMWEQREVELERNITQMERNASQIAGAASQFEEALGNLPDMKLPVANQLEQAISTIRSNVKVILDTQAESKVLKQRVAELEKELRTAEHTVVQRDKLISELRLRMPATAERDEIILKATTKTAQSALHAQARTADFEETQALKIAQSTMNSLKQRIQQKEETIIKYQELLGQARDDMLDMNKQHEEELKSMQAKIHLKTDDAFTKFKEAAQELMNKQLTTRGVSDKQMQRINELEDVLAQSENAILALTEKARQKDAEIAQLKQNVKQAANIHTTEKERTTLIHKEVEEKKDLDLDECKLIIGEQKKEIEILNEEINALKDSNNRAPTVTMKNLVERLKNQLALKEKQHQALSKALTELRADMVAQAQETVKTNLADAGQEHNVQRLIDQQTKQLNEQIEDLQTQTDKQRKELKKRKELQSNLATELEDVKEDLDQKDRSLSKLKNDKTRLEHEVDELEKKIDRMNTMRKQKTGDFERQHELDETRRRLRLVEEELKKKQQTAEKPYEKEEKKGDELAKWEESKKWQRTIEKMKNKLKDREIEVEKLNKTIEMMKVNMDRVSREKDSIESRSRALSKSSAPQLGSAAPPSKKQHSIQDLKQKNYMLEEELNTLRRQKIMTGNSKDKDIRLYNQQLLEQIEDLKRALESEDGSVSAFDYQKLFEKNQELQKEILKLSEENIELKFEAEQSKRDVPRQRDRISDLQKYIEALKFENSQLGGASSARSLASSVSSIRRIGESGKSTRELEKTIALLKKVVEKTQSENEILKRSANGSGSEQISFLKQENDSLKNQLDEVKLKMGATLSERYTSHQKGTAKMMTDYDKLRKELVKEKEMNEKLRIELRSKEMEKEQQMNQLELTKSKLEIEEAKRPSNNSDSKGWKSAVVTRMYEDQINTLEADIDKKNNIIADNKKLLKAAAEKEQNFIEEKSQLLHQISILERLPPGIQVKDSDLMKEYQQARIKIDKLEIEKKELIQEIRMYRKGDINSELLDDDILTKASKYDRILEENVDVRVDYKTAALERDKFKMEVNKLKKELDNFGPEFFEEIEDLKYNYKQAVEKNVLYEEKLLNISKQFGIHLNIPGLDT